MQLGRDEAGLAFHIGGVALYDATPLIWRGSYCGALWVGVQPRAELCEAEGCSMIASAIPFLVRTDRRC